jgi:tetrahydromethanopterin S-methyltransferase subunit B
MSSLSHADNGSARIAIVNALSSEASLLDSQDSGLDSKFNTLIGISTSGIPIALSQYQKISLAYLTCALVFFLLTIALSVYAILNSDRKSALDEVQPYKEKIHQLIAVFDELIDNMHTANKTNKKALRKRQLIFRCSLFLFAAAFGTTIFIFIKVFSA